MEFILDMVSLQKMRVLPNCVKNVNIEFIGPTSDAISRMGTKDVARETMREAGVPIVPGSTGIVADEQEALRNR